MQLVLTILSLSFGVYATCVILNVYDNWRNKKLAKSKSFYAGGHIIVNQFDYDETFKKILEESKALSREITARVAVKEKMNQVFKD